MAGRERRLAKWRMRYPTVPELERRARRRIPYFAYDFLMGGTGEETNRGRNITALKAVELVPRYCVDVAKASTAVRLFGRAYRSPVVISVIGMDGAIWPGATRHLAETAHEAGLPYLTGTMATAPMEQVAQIAPDSFWFQLYSFPAQDHRVTFDLVRRADAAGALVLAVTVDVPAAGRRVRDMRNGFTAPRTITPRVAAGTLMRPAWLAATLREGMPHAQNLAPYCRPGARGREIDLFVKNGRSGSGVTWETLARIRDQWPRALVLKGVQHPADAEKALALGLDGVVVSNHGGRQFEPAPATIDVLPAIRAAVGRRMTLLMDGGIMSGTDALIALACGADAVLAGRAFMLGLAALGADGARHVADTLTDELRIALAQSGAVDAAGASMLARRHRNAWRPEDFEVPARAVAALEPSSPAREIQYERGREGADPGSVSNTRELQS
jgi:L-lactate dehydrogenase (cytochrome)